MMDGGSELEIEGEQGDGKYGWWMGYYGSSLKNRVW